MTREKREELIEKIGIAATDEIQKLQNQIYELHEFLNVIRVAGVERYRLERSPMKGMHGEISSGCGSKV